MEQKTNTRGGARPGSGRKMGKEQKTTVSFRVTDLTKMNIAYLRERGYDVTRMIEDYLDKMTDELMDEETRDD